MKTLRIFVLAAAVGMPLFTIAAPAVKITSPTKSPTTNGLLNASGTVKSKTSIAAVYYSFDGGAWTAADGTTNWSAANLVLTAGANTFSAYAVDTNAIASKTNTVTFTYVVKLPISISTNGAGSVTIKDGAFLQIGKTYKLSAKAAKGFGFTGWTGSLTTNSAKLSFVMTSNATFTANFADTARPLCVITFPAVKHTVTNSPIIVTGRASDNVGVESLAYQLNGGGWKQATIIDGTNWTTAPTELALTPGTNTVQAFAGDAAGHFSPTNTVNFTYVSNAPPPPVGPAPLSIAGTTAQVSVNGGLVEISFGDGTFSQDGGGGDSSSVGNYTYSLLSSNIAQLNLTSLVPPQDAGEGDQVTLTFADNTDATLTDTNGSAGTITFAPAASLAPDPSTTFAVQWVDMIGVTNTLTLAAGRFTNVDSDGNVNSGGYVVESFSPFGVMLSLTVNDGPLTGYDLFLQLDFFDASTGDISISVFDNTSSFLESYEESFTILSTANPPAGNAPVSLAGTQWSVTLAGKDSFQISFGTSTYSQTGSVSERNEVGNYIYMRTGPNTAIFKNIQTLPPNNPGNSTDPEKFLVHLTFSKSTAASIVSTNVDNGKTNIQTGSISAKAVATLAPVSLSGKTIVLSLGGHNGTLALNTDGTFQLNSNSGTSDSGTYNYSQFSPACYMVTLFTTASNVGDEGKTSYVQLSFISSTVRDAFVTTFDSLGNFDNTLSGTFSIH
jgi:uncharacterized repeat protein (TIGR02543 family)